MRIGIGLLTAAALAWGCASTQEHKTANVEEMLAASGFEARPATTPEQQAHLKTLEQHQLVMRPKDDKVYYFYADAADCNCLYVGDQADYENFQALAEREKLAKEQREAAEAQENAEMDWGMWGPWW